MMMKMCRVTYTKGSEYAPLSNKADRYGNKTFWRADYGTHSIAWGDSKTECMQEAREYIKRHNATEGK